MISSWYNGRCVLVTGATGFMGKVLVEKLLRSCPGIRRVYLLLRPKRGVEPEQRLREMTGITLFDTIRRNQPHLLSKLHAIPGDITSPGLGLSAEHAQLLQQEISVVFHSAATVKFDEKLRLSVEMNVLGMQRLVELAKKMTNLEAFVHVSTAYCNCDQEVVAEKVYPPPADPETVIKCIDVLDDQILDTVTKSLIGNRPNTYTFTKAMAESVIVEMSAGLPVAIVRPSIVTAAWKEPLPGWVDNLNGPTGLLAGAGKGILRTIVCHRDLLADFMPVDVCINLLITVAWHTGINRPSSIPVYNCTSGAVNPVTWGQLESEGHKSLLRNPFSGVLWYPGGSFKRSRIYNSVCVTAFHTIPAYLIDVMARLSGKKPFMLNVQTKLHRATSCLEFFTTHEWRFPNDNAQRLWRSLSEQDRAQFPFDVTGLDWTKYLECYALGTRRYIMKEDDSTLPKARVHLQRMLWLDRFVKVLLLFMTWRILIRHSAKAQYLNRMLWRILHMFRRQVTKA
ncbi:putative fatty acyl-CoA reductase CG5065 [Ctenocephalides felis]|uniref:putative fatty acyl-CoA reductase CG5065 n=1 Tax=Ctenocephalides felis TaxID=7515 RepID=UPI000E6E2F63|nr:putative fatty acyl-CoA reductase CG5065 [Ctenocephalides felis]